MATEPEIIAVVRQGEYSERLTFLYKIVEDTQNTVRFLDTKAAFCVTLFSGMGAGVLEHHAPETTLHRALFAACFDALRPGGTIVVQMPANETETAKVEVGKLARETPWNTMLGGRERAFHEEPPEFYAAMLAQLGYDRIDCYHLTFHHPMDRPADVVQWYRSTGLRPFLDALPKDRHDEFLAQLTTRLDAAYGTTGAMTFDFKRLFIWGRRRGP